MIRLKCKTPKMDVQKVLKNPTLAVLTLFCLKNGLKGHLNANKRYGSR